MTDLFLNDDILYQNGVADIKIKQNDIRKFKNLQWGTQNIGFRNWLVHNRAYILKSNYHIKKLEYELAKCKKKVSREKLKQIEMELDKSKDMHDKFLSKAVFAD